MAQSTAGFWVVGKEVSIVQSKTRYNGLKGSVTGRPKQDNSGLYRYPIKITDPDTGEVVKFMAGHLNLHVEPQARSFADEQPQQVLVTMKALGGIQLSLDDFSIPMGVRDYLIAATRAEQEGHPEKVDWSPQPDGDGKTRLWGLDPQSSSNGHFNEKAVQTLGSRSNSTTVYTGTTGRPERQLAVILGSAKVARITEQRKARRSLLTKEFVLRIELCRVQPPVYRFVRVSGCTSLRTLQEKIMKPAFGWSSCYHGYYYTDLRDGTLFGNEAGKGVDSELMKCYHGHYFIDDREILVGDLLEKAGDELEWLHDLGVRWEHRIVVHEVRKERMHGSLSKESVLLPPYVAGPEDENMGILRMLEFMQVTGEDLTSIGVMTRIGIIVLGGQGACPPEDGNGCEEEHQGMMLTGFNPATGVMAFDTLYIGENGNDLYSRSIAKPNGVLVNPAHPQYAKKNADALSSTNYKGVLDHGHGSTFDPHLFDVTVHNARVNDSLQQGCMCSDCMNAQQSHWKQRRTEAVCEHCLLARPKLNTCARCLNSFYCGEECQRLHWPIHKAACNEFFAKRKAAKTLQTPTPPVARERETMMARQRTQESTKAQIDYFDYPLHYVSVMNFCIGAWLAEGAFRIFSLKCDNYKL